MQSQASISLITTETSRSQSSLARPLRLCRRSRFRHYARPEMNPSWAPNRASVSRVPPDRNSKDPPVRPLYRRLYHGCIAPLLERGHCCRAQVYRPRARISPPRDQDAKPACRTWQRARQLVRRRQPTHQRQAEEALNHLNARFPPGNMVGLFANGWTLSCARARGSSRSAASSWPRGSALRFAGSLLSRGAATAHMVQALDRAGAVAPPGLGPLCHTRNFLTQTRWLPDAVSSIRPERAPPVGPWGARIEDAQADLRLLEAPLEDYASGRFQKRHKHLKSVFAKTDTDRQSELMLYCPNLVRP